MIKYCQVCGLSIEFPKDVDHMHCANCWDLEPVTSTIGHWSLETGGFSCEKMSAPEFFCNQCGQKLEQHCPICSECPNEDCEHRLEIVDLVPVEENDDHSELY